MRIDASAPRSARHDLGKSSGYYNHALTAMALGLMYGDLFLLPRSPREETHCIRHVISNGGTRRKLPGKYNEPPDPDECAYPLTCVVVCGPRVGYHLRAGLRGLLGGKPPRGLNSSQEDSSSYSSSRKNVRVSSSSTVLRQSNSCVVPSGSAKSRIRQF